SLSCSSYSAFCVAGLMLWPFASRRQALLYHKFSFWPFVAYNLVYAGLLFGSSPVCVWHRYTVELQRRPFDATPLACTCFTAVFVIPCISCRLVNALALRQ